MLFGVLPDSQYHVRDLTLAAGDRLLLYTDGIVEAEDASGDAFGDRRLKQVLRAHHMQPAVEVLEHMLAELHSWRPREASQQDDVTLIVIDVV